MIKATLAKLLTLKVGAAAVAATATIGGGVALAAGNGVMPAPFGGAKPTVTATAEATEKAKAAKSDKDPAASPSPSLVGLCHAVTAGAGDNPGKALENPAFTALITAAGGKDKVGAYCEALLATAASKAPAGNKPTTRPSGAAKVHPTGAPTAPSTGRPDHPTGAPTTGPAR